MTRSVAFALLALLLIVGQASAECAWVLWWEEHTSWSGGKVDPGETNSWNILGSFATQADCERQQEWKIGSILEGWRKEKAEAKSGEQHTVTHEPGTNII